MRFTPNVPILNAEEQGMLRLRELESAAHERTSETGSSLLDCAVLIALVAFATIVSVQYVGQEVRGDLAEVSVELGYTEQTAVDITTATKVRHGKAVGAGNGAGKNK
jgi:hypothetical protein